MKPFIDINKVSKISELFDWKEHSVDELVNLLIKSGFSTNQVLLYYNIRKEPKGIIFDILKSNAFSKDILDKLSNFSDNLLLLDINLSKGLKSILSEIDFNNETDFNTESKKDDLNLNKLILWNLENEVKKCVINWLKTKDYLVYLRELVNIINNRMKLFAKEKGISYDKWENELVKLIFENNDFFMEWLDMIKVSWKNWKDWLYNILKWVFNLRNAFSHDSIDSNFIKKLSINNVKFIEFALTIDFLLKEINKIK